MLAVIPKADNNAEAARQAAINAAQAAAANTAQTTTQKQGGNQTTNTGNTPAANTGAAAAPSGATGGSNTTPTVAGGLVTTTSNAGNNANNANNGNSGAANVSLGGGSSGAGTASVNGALSMPGSGAASGSPVDNGQQNTVVPRDSVITAAASAQGASVVAATSITASIAMPQPSNAIDYLARGNAYTSNGNYEKAAADYKQAIQENPKLAEAYLNLGIIDNNTGNRAEALSNITIALNLDIALARRLSPDIIQKLPTSIQLQVNNYLK